METKEAINAGNKLIAEFMGYTYYGHNDPRIAPLDNRETPKPGWKKHPLASNFNKFNLTRYGRDAYLCRKHDQLRYFNEWGWIMPVVQKINKIGYPQTDYSFTIYSNAAEVEKNGPFGDTISCNRMTDETTWLELVWTTVVEFIEFYNFLQNEQGRSSQTD
jgi:hypothetical protein